MEPELALSIRQFSGAWDLICRAAPGYTRATLPGLDVIFSGLPIPFFNVAIVSDDGISASRLRSIAGEAAAWARDKSVPWFLVVTHEVLSGTDSEEVLAGAGFVPAVQLAGMVAEDVAPAGSLPENLELIEPSDDDSSAPMVTINSAAYGLDGGGGMDAMGSFAFWRQHIAVIGTVNGSPVSCTGVFMVDGFRYVAFVATHPDHQHRGYADAVMRRCLERAGEIHGRHPTVLHATEAGRPVYERMGYRTISTHTLFLPEQFAEEH